jgi:hypothetical protein
VLVSVRESVVPLMMPVISVAAIRNPGRKLPMNKRGR